MVTPWWYTLHHTFYCWWFRMLSRGWVFSYCVGWKAFKSKGFRRYYLFWTKAYILLLFSGFSIFFKNSFRKKLPLFFCTFDTSFHLFLYDYVHVFVSVFLLWTSIISIRAQIGYSVKDDLLFNRDMSIARQNICYCYIFPLDTFFD